MKSKRNDIAVFVLITIVLLLMSLIASRLNFRIDLTSDKRHTLSDQTRNILESLDGDVYIEVFLDGDMRVEFSHLRRELVARLDEFRIITGRKLDYRFINPSSSDDPEERYRFQMSLINKGLVPVTVMGQDKEGEQTEKVIFPGLIVNYNGIEMPVNFLRNNPAISASQNLTYSIEGLEYELISAISTISADTIHRVAFLEGHGELGEVEVADLTLELAKFFTIDRGTIGGQPGVLDDYSAVVIAGPAHAFSEDDKVVIDQYLMQGGRVLWLIDEVSVNRDSLTRGSSIAFYRPLELEDMLFRYGIRINPVLIQDTDCQIIPVVSSFDGVRQQTIPVHWLYNPLLYPSLNSPVTRAINKVRGEFVSYIDTVGDDRSLRKKVLLATSPASRFVSPPRPVSLNEFRDMPPEESFTEKYLPVAVLVEGSFKSLYANRLDKYKGTELIKESIPTRMIVVADGDIARNDVRRDGARLVPMTLGQDRTTQQIYGNKDFLVNALNYLVDDKGIMDLRSRELKMRLLDRNRIRDHRLFWQLLNSAGPLIIVVIAGLLYLWFRKRKYGTLR